MNILLFCTKISLDENDPWLTNDLANAFVKAGHSVTVCCIDWYRAGETQIYKHNSGVKIINYRVPNANTNNQYWNNVVKFFKWFLISIPAGLFFYKKLKRESFDLLINFSPASVFSFAFFLFDWKFTFKKYLVLWDFFPDHQRALGLLKSNFVFRTLRAIETRIFSKQQVIGCMSEDNIKYLLSKYSFSSDVKAEILPLWGPAESNFNPLLVDRGTERKKLGIAEDDFVCVFGGQLIQGRGLESILKLAQRFNVSNPRIKFLIVGDGPQKKLVQSEMSKFGLTNLKLIDRMPRNSYLNLISAMDVGLVLTVGNVGMPAFPSKSIDFMRAGIPIIAAIEESSDFGVTLTSKFQAGLYCESSDTEGIAKNIELLFKDRVLRDSFGKNGLQYYQNNLRAGSAVNSILSQLEL